MNKIKKYFRIGILTLGVCFCYVFNVFAAHTGNYSYNLKKGNEAFFVNNVVEEEGYMKAKSNKPQGAKYGNASVTIKIEEISKYTSERWRARGTYNQQFVNNDYTVLRRIAKYNRVKVSVESLLDTARGNATWLFSGSLVGM